MGLLDFILQQRRMDEERRTADIETAFKLLGAGQKEQAAALLKKHQIDTSDLTSPEDIRIREEAIRQGFERTGEVHRAGLVQEGAQQQLGREKELQAHVTSERIRGEQATNPQAQLAGLFQKKARGEPWTPEEQEHINSAMEYQLAISGREPAAKRTFTEGIYKAINEGRPLTYYQEQEMKASWGAKPGSIEERVMEKYIDSGGDPEKMEQGDRKYFEEFIKPRFHAEVERIRENVEGSRESRVIRREEIGERRASREALQEERGERRKDREQADIEKRDEAQSKRLERSLTQIQRIRDAAARRRNEALPKDKQKISEQEEEDITRYVESQIKRNPDLSEELRPYLKIRRKRTPEEIRKEVFGVR